MATEPPLPPLTAPRACILHLSTGQVELYDGFLFGPHSDHTRGQFVCVDRDAEGAVAS